MLVLSCGTPGEAPPHTHSEKWENHLLAFLEGLTELRM